MSFLDLDYTTPLTIKSNTRSFVGRTLNRKTQTVNSDAQTWSMTITLAPSTNRETAPAGGRLSSHFARHGDFEAFTIDMPQHPQVPEAVSGTVTNLQMRGVTSSGETDVAVDSTSTVTLPEGLFITIGSDKKVYQVSEAVTVLSSDTDAVLKVYPPLVQDTVNNATIDITPSIDVYYSTSGGQSVTYNQGVLIQATISVEEALV